MAYEVRWSIPRFIFLQGRYRENNMAAPIRIIWRRTPFSKTLHSVQPGNALGNRVEVLVVFPIGKGPIKEVCRYSSRRKIALHSLKNILSLYFSHWFKAPFSLSGLFPVKTTQGVRDLSGAQTCRTWQRTPKRFVISLVTRAFKEPCVTLMRWFFRGLRHFSLYCSWLHCASQILLPAFFLKTSWRFGAAQCRASLLAPFFQQHLLTSCLWVTFGYFLQYFNFYYYYIFMVICDSDLWCYY